jgi:hypothetical protein
MHEVPDILGRALTEPITLSFGDHVEAKNWVFRAHNYIRRHAPEMRQLMITRSGPNVRVRVPHFTIQGETR